MKSSRQDRKVRDKGSEPDSSYTQEYDRFERLTKRLLQVPKEEIKREEKRAKKAR